MIDIADDERRRAFSTWLRTGRLPPAGSRDGVELKFNPWHDPRDGRFTFVGAGRHYLQGSAGGFSSGRRAAGGGGATGSWQTGPSRGKVDSSRSPTTHTAKTRISYPTGRAASPKAGNQRPFARGGWTDSGFAGGGGGSFGGAGASGDWTSLEPRRGPTASPTSNTVAALPNLAGATKPAPIRTSAAISAEQFRTIVRHGYAYQIDSRGRTRRVTGALTISNAPRRSRAAQARAGGADRRHSDDGGHYIAARFNGPTEAFNHFAQDANFNRGGYRALEDRWAGAKRAGKTVTVTIVPQFEQKSTRPSRIDVWFTIDGRLEGQKFPNERSEKLRGK